MVSPFAKGARPASISKSAPPPRQAKQRRPGQQETGRLGRQENPDLGTWEHVAVDVQVRSARGQGSVRRQSPWAVTKAGFQEGDNVR